MWKKRFSSRGWVEYDRTYDWKAFCASDVCCGSKDGQVPESVSASHEPGVGGGGGPTLIVP